MGKYTFQVLQDGDDIKNGVIQLSICENTNSAYIYFTLAGWEDFKGAINQVEKASNHEDMATELIDNPLHALYRDDSRDIKAIEIIFGGVLSIEMYFQGKDLKLWALFKKAVNTFKPEAPKI